MWVYGHTRLADYYAGDLSFRELANRLYALPMTPPNRAPIWDVIAAAEEAAENERKAAELDDVLNRYR